MAEPRERLRVAARLDEPFYPEALRLAASLCGVELVGVPLGAQESEIAWVEDGTEYKAALRIPRVGSYTEADIPGLPDESALERALSTGRFPFDLIAALRFWIADEGNAAAPDSSFDKHGRLRPAASVQARLGLLDVPIVNAYLLLFRRILERQFGIEARGFLPEGKRCAVILTHDVDRPLDPRDLRQAAGLARRSLAAGRPSAVPYLGFALAKAASARLRDPGGRHWVFPELLAAERKHGFRSTFFFAATSRFSPHGHYLDVGYDVTAPPFPELCHHLAADGFDVGLHVGYRSGERVELLREERERLSSVAGVDVRGTRHHYWHLGKAFWETLERHVAAGLGHDLSTAFSDAAGYRLGVALPHRAWNPERSRAVPTVEVPTMAMDGAFFYNPAMTVEAALEQLEALIGTLKRFEGIAAVDWHQETSIPASKRFEKWGHCYLALLDMLASDSEIAVCTAAEAAGKAPPE